MQREVELLVGYLLVVLRVYQKMMPESRRQRRDSHDCRRLRLVTVRLRQLSRAGCPAGQGPGSITGRAVSERVCHEASLLSRRLRPMSDDEAADSAEGRHSGPRLTAAAGDRQLRFGGGCGVDVVAVRGFRNDRGLCPMHRKSLPWIRVTR
jgi:hypothetical protein